MKESCRSNTYQSWQYVIFSWIEENITRNQFISNIIYKWMFKCFTFNSRFRYSLCIHQDGVWCSGYRCLRPTLGTRNNSVPLLHYNKMLQNVVIGILCYILNNYFKLFSYMHGTLYVTFNVHSSLPIFATSWHQTYYFGWFCNVYLNLPKPPECLLQFNQGGGSEDLLGTSRWVP